MVLLGLNCSAMEYIQSEGMVFSILSETEHLCAFEQNKEYPYEGDFIIPDSINLGGELYQIYQINDSAFFNCDKLASLYIPPTIKVIGDDVFNNCKGLNRLLIGDGTIPLHLGNQIGWGDRIPLFSGVPIKEIYIGRNLTYYKSNFSTYYTYAPFCGTGIETVILGDLVTTIGPCLFTGCQDITNIKFGKKISRIGSHAFEEGWNFSKLELPLGINSIGKNAFYGNPSIREIVLPETLTSIDEDAFSDCRNIWSVTCFAVTPPTARYAYYDVKNARLRVPLESVGVYKKASGWMDFGEILSIDGEANPYPNIYNLTYAISEGGLIREQVREGDSRKIEFIPPEGYIIHSITLNDIEQQYDSNLKFDIDFNSITEDQFLRIVYLQNKESFTEELEAHTNKVILLQDVVVIEGDFISSCLYSLDGQVLYSGNDRSIKLPYSGIFILKIDNQVYKFFATN